MEWPQGTKHQLNGCLSLTAAAMPCSPLPRPQGSTGSFTQGHGHCSLGGPPPVLLWPAVVCTRGLLTCGIRLPPRRCDWQRRAGSWVEQWPPQDLWEGAEMQATPPWVHEPPGSSIWPCLSGSLWSALAFRKLMPAASPVAACQVAAEKVM